MPDLGLTTQTVPGSTSSAASSWQDDEIHGLIAACLAGDESAYTRLYERFSVLIYRLSYGLLQSREDAEEVLQDSFEYAFRKLGKYDPGKSAFKSWLYQIAISRCRNKRRRKLLPSFSLSRLAERDAADRKAPSPEELSALSERQKLIWAALAKLSPKLRETAVLRYYEDLTYGEIGHVLGIPAKTAESRMRLAHRALRDLIASPD